MEAPAPLSTRKIPVACASAIPNARPIAFANEWTPLQSLALCDYSHLLICQCKRCHRIPHLGHLAAYVVIESVQKLILGARSGRKEQAEPEQHTTCTPAGPSAASADSSA